MAQDRYVVGDVAFDDIDMAKKAAAEAKRIESLNANINYENTKAVVSLYQKAQAGRVFQTPIGISYMLQLQGYLSEHGIAQGDIAPVEFSVSEAAGKDKSKNSSKGAEDAAGEAEGGGDDANDDSDHMSRLSAAKREKVYEARINAQKNKMQEQLALIKKQWIVMIALGVVIVVMFIISLTGNNPTIINYRSKILNQYSEWEQELTERENALSQKERAAGASVE